MIVDCDKDVCAIVFGAGRTTLVEWEPVYDKEGVLLNSDPNTYSYTKECKTCGRTWTTNRNSRFEKSSEVNVETTAVIAVAEEVTANTANIEIKGA